MNCIYFRITFKTISPPKMIQNDLWGPLYLLCQWLYCPLLPQMKSNLREIDTGPNFIFNWRPSCCCLGWSAHLSVSPNRGQYIDNCLARKINIDVAPDGFWVKVLCFVPVPRNKEAVNLETESQTGTEIESDRWGVGCCWWWVAALVPTPVER